MKRFLSSVVVIFLLFTNACAESATVALNELYAQAELLMVQGDYAGAAAKFEALGAYSDASQMTMYCKAIAAAETLGMYSMAVDAFNDLDNFKDSKQMAKYYNGRAYEAAGLIDVTAASDSELDKALLDCAEAEKIYGELAFFKDSLNRAATCDEQIKEIKSEQSQRVANKTEATYQNAVTLEQNGNYDEAIKLYQTIKEYKDCLERISNCETAILDDKYNTAVRLMKDGKYGDAYDTFVALNGYKDSEAQATSIRDKADTEKLLLSLSNATVGSYITFGTYEQDNNTSNGKEVVEWLVLAKENNRLLVISRYGLDCKPFKDSGALSATWGTCTLRTWLNEDFLNNTFSNTEQAMIPTVTVSADKNPKYDTNPGSDTQDKVFLLSVEEVFRYFATDSIQYGSAIECQATAYTRAKGAYYGKYSYNCMWWLRTPGINSEYVATACDLGGCARSDDDERAVRPALWVEIPE